MLSIGKFGKNQWAPRGNPFMLSIGKCGKNQWARGKHGKNEWNHLQSIFFELKKCHFLWLALYHTDEHL